MLSGIAGFWTREPNDVRTLAVFTDMLVGRGPNGRGLVMADNKRLGLGHRRLHTGNADFTSDQPLVSSDHRYAIVFNGEIYNGSEVRSELDAVGRQVGSGTDAELFLAAYTQWGPDCQNRFNGDWSVVIWDNAERSLFMSRDRFGNKPLLCVKNANGLAFASERKAFFALPWANTSETPMSLERNPMQVVQSGLQSCTTGSNGRCTFKQGAFPSKANGAEFTVHAVIDSNLAYDSSNNTDPDGDSSGTMIALSKN
jgi:asparagine synthetase B (glutamine-hydrolysing)